MKKKVTKTPKKPPVCVDKVGAQRDTWFKQTPKKSAVCACKVGVSKKEQKSVRCAAKSTPICSKGYIPTRVKSARKTFLKAGSVLLIVFT